MIQKPKHNVVLGDPQHQFADGLESVFQNSPNSLREVEPTVTFSEDGN